MSKGSFPTDRIICIDLGELKCKIIMPIPLSYKAKISNLSNPRIQKEIAEDIAFSIGWLEGAMEENGAILTEVDIVLPFNGQYLELEKNISGIFSEKGIAVRVLSGRTIKIPFGEINVYRNSFENQIKGFAKTMFKSN